MEKHARLHLAEERRANPRFRCDACGRRFEFQNKLQRHVQLEHGSEAVFKCTQCGKAFKTLSSVHYHMRLHTGERPYHCDKCPKAYATGNRLNNHIKRMHSGNLRRDHTCEVCGKMFEHNSTLMMHRNAHFADSRTERCHICGWSTYSKGSLKKHLRSHTDNKPFVCSECGKRFAHKPVLLVHMESHNPDRTRLDCPLCNKSYVTDRSLKTHLLRHQGEKKYECDICDASYTVHNHLNRHRWEKHKIMPYKCDACDSSFTHVRALKEHCIEAHYQQPNLQQQLP
jgi:KRAB domain-containing zinc finger protein